MSERAVEELSQRQAGEAVYLRFGAAPKDGRSRGLDTARERGVSVFSARKSQEGKYRIYLKTEAAATSLVAVVAENRRVYEVEGEPVGKGTDGEPLLSVTDRRRIRPPITLEPSDYEEVIDGYLKSRRDWYFPERGYREPDTSRPQQVTTIGSLRLGSPPKKRKKRKKK